MTEVRVNEWTANKIAGGKKENIVTTIIVVIFKAFVSYTVDRANR